MTALQPRPRIVTAAFWCWLVASVLLVAFGMLVALSPDNLPVLFRGAGAIFAASGLGLGYLAGRARLGEARFRRAAVALALAIVAMLALFVFMSRGPVWLVVMIVTLVGAILMMRPAAQDWFDTEETQE
jgi:hypothetical protein